MKRESFWKPFFVLLLVFLSACQRSSEEKPQPQPQAEMATTPQPCNLGNQTNPYWGNQACSQFQNWGDPSQWTWNYGQWYWPTYFNGSDPRCGCPVGFFPVWGPYGLACAPQAYQIYGFVYWGQDRNLWWLTPQNVGPSNIPNIYYEPPQSQRTYTQCLTQSAAGCDVRASSNCPLNSQCVAVAGGSFFGICVAR